MDRFETSLHVHAIDARGDVWELDAPLIYHSAELGRVIVPEEFLTDFLTFPRWVPFFSGQLRGRAPQASVVHDWLYDSLCPLPIPRDMADRVYRSAIIVSGESELIADTLYYGVRGFGWTRFRTEERTEERGRWKVRRNSNLFRRFGDRRKKHIPDIVMERRETERRGCRGDS